MNILLIANLYPIRMDPNRGIFTARRFAALHEMGAEVSVIVPIIRIPKIFQIIKKKWHQYNQKWQPVQFEGLPAISIPYIQPTRDYSLYRWAVLSAYYSVKKVALKRHAQKPFDIIWGKGFFPCADVADRLSKRLHIPAVGEGIGGDVHVVPDSHPSMFKPFVRLCKSLDGVVANGRATAERIEAIRRQHVPCSHGLVDLDLFAPTEDKRTIRHDLNLPDDRVIALYVGAFNRAKGIFEMLDAFGQARKIFPNLLLKICGYRGNLTNLKEIIAEQNLADTVEVVGAVPAEEVSRWMKACDLFILASHTEGMPNVVMEAMACGLPVVTTTVGGLPDAVGDCDGVILVEPKKVEPLQEAILKVACNHQLRQFMGQAARKCAEEKFGIKNNTLRTLRFMEELVRQYHERSEH